VLFVYERDGDLISYRVGVAACTLGRTAALLAGPRVVAALALLGISRAPKKKAQTPSIGRSKCALSLSDPNSRQRKSSGFHKAPSAAQSAYATFIRKTQQTAPKLTKQTTQQK
jgi:hypothetical protein